jgi:ribosomal protein L31
MRINVKAAALTAAVGTLAIAVPAGAHPGSAGHPGASNHAAENSSKSHGGGANHPSQSHRCRPHQVAYVESGTIDSATPSTLAANSDGTWSGTLIVDVTSANHWAKADRSKTVTYTFNASKLKVRFADRASGFSAGEPVKLIGKLATQAGPCTATGTAASPVFNRVVVHPVASTNS